MLHDFGLADMGAGGAYTHRLAMNVWAGRGLSPAPDNMARLTHYTLIAHDPDVMANAKNVAPNDVGLRGRDPSGTTFDMVAA